MEVRRVHLYGLAALILGALILAVLAALPSDHLPVAIWWLQDNVLQPNLLLPLAGFGLATALVGRRAIAFAIVAFAIGLAAGFSDDAIWDSVFSQVPFAFENQFYSAPLAAIIVGATLILPDRARKLALPLAAFCVGAMLSLCIVMTDPTSGAPSIPVIGLIFAAWLAVSLHICASTFKRYRVDIAMRIFGSWLVAIGILYGGATLFRQPKHLDLPPPTPMEPGAMVPGFQQPFPPEDAPSGAFSPPGDTSTF